MNKSKNIISLFLSVILVTGTIVLSFSSSFMTANVQAQSSYNNNYYKFKDNNNVNINKIKCINDNINVNGINSGDINAGNKGVKEGNLDAYSSNNGEGYYNDGYGNKQGKGFNCVINNNNNNTNIAISEGIQTVTPQEPETTTATLTVKKQVFGCDNVFGSFLTMDCSELENNSPEWLNCNDNPAINDTIFCQSLPEGTFDIEVLDDQNNQIQQFEGSEQGTAIENLEPGTYTVNEIKYSEGFDELRENPDSELPCENSGFTDGGALFAFTPSITYPIICIEYEDEQGNDCNTITLAAGEERTCIVKNYIWVAQDVP